MSNCPVLILGNKIDKPGAASEDEMRAYFNLYGQTTGKVIFRNIWFYRKSKCKVATYLGEVWHNVWTRRQILKLKPVTLLLTGWKQRRNRTRCLLTHALCHMSPPCSPQYVAHLIAVDSFRNLHTIKCSFSRHFMKLANIEKKKKSAASKNIQLLDLSQIWVYCNLFFLQSS